MPTNENATHIFVLQNLFLKNIKTFKVIKVKMRVDKLSIFKKVFRENNISPLSSSFQAAVVAELKNVIGKEVDLKYIHLYQVTV